MLKMLFQTHLMLGIVFFLLLENFFPDNQFVVLFLVLLGSILPDIDDYRSKINQWSGFIGRIIAFFTQHRGMFHSLLLYLGLFFVMAYFWEEYYGRALFLGYLAHLIGDGMTKQGLQVFYPFSKFKVRGPVRVGGYLELIIFLLLVVVVLKMLI